MKEKICGGLQILVIYCTVYCTLLIRFINNTENTGDILVLHKNYGFQCHYHTIHVQLSYIYGSIFLICCCTALLKAEFFIEPLPDTQRRRRGERGIGIAMGCYLPTPALPPLPLPPPHITRLSHRLRLRYQD
jgi:hypothetical protein